MLLRRYALLCSLLTLVLVAPSSAGAQPAPGPFVQQAFDLLMDRFVRPPSSAVLLSGGWDGGLSYLKDAAGAGPVGPPPSFSGDRGADWNAFLAAYPALVGTGGSSVDQHALDLAIVTGMAKSLNSSHTRVITEAQSGSSYGGVGLSVSRALIVTSVFEGTPAEAAGLRLGDRLVAVDGISVEGMTANDASQLVRGPVGTTAQLTLQRFDQPDLVNLAIMRAQITVPWVNSKILDEGIGYLQLRSVPDGDVLGPFDQAIARLDGADIKALVIDVRGNSGGSLTTPVKVVSRFVLQGPALQCTNRQGQSRTTNVDGSTWGRNVPIAILINDDTSSAAELVTADLKESVAAYLIGSKTAGAFEASQLFPLNDGSTLVVGVQACRSGQGREIEHNGLDPDRATELDPAMLATGHDNQLEAAIDYLRTKMGP